MAGSEKEKKNHPSGQAGNPQPPAATPTGKPEANSEAQGRANASRKIGQVLISEGAITAGQLNEALAQQTQKGGFIGQILVDLGYVKQDAIVLALVRQCKIPHLSLLNYEISKDVLRLVPKEVCLSRSLLPIDKMGSILTVAMVNPLDMEALDDVRRRCPSLRIKPILCDWQQFELVARRIFGEGDDKKDRDFGVPTFGPGAPKNKPVKASEKATTAEKGAQPGAAGTAAEPHVASGAVNAALDAAVSQVIREAEATGTPPVPRRSTETMPSVALDVPTQDLATLMGETLAGAMQDAMSNMTAQARANAERVHATAPWGSPQLLANLVREGVRGAMQEVFATMMVHMRSNANAQTPAPADEYVDALRSGVTNAVQQALGSVTDEEGADAGETQIPPSASSTPDIASLLRSTVREALREYEAGAVARMGRRDLDDNERARREKHASVTPLWGSESKPSDGENMEADQRVLKAISSEHLFAGFTFDTFVVGANNAFTVKLCQAVAANPGGQYNPLFLYGDVGLGKSHLINAIGNAIHSRAPEQRVGCVSASRFASRLTEAIRDQAVDAFRENYCHWDTLILDDVQFLGGRVEAQEEFFHIFNVLKQEGRQVIIAADKAPDRLGLLEQRLVSRFAGGIVACLHPPEWEARMQILRQETAAKSMEVNDEILTLIAMRVPNDIRKMIGALRNVVAYAGLVGKGITCEMANEILSHLATEEAA